MVQTRFYDPTFLAQWRADNKTYVGGGNTAVRVAGSQGYNTYLGFPSKLRDDIISSKIKTTMRLSIYVTDGATFDIGRHKEASDKKSNGLPWYEYTGISQALTEGRRKIDITSFIDEFRDKGFTGLVLYGATGANFGSAYGLSGDDYRLVIELDGDWNNPPTKPAMTYPRGGETLSGYVTLRATPSTDPETPQNQLIYQWGIYDGTKWSYFSSAPGQTDITVDFSMLNETSIGSASVRAFDGTDFSEWTNVPAVFSIKRNVAPGTPINLRPSGGSSVDRSQIIAFSWDHNDSDPQSRFSLRYRLRGASNWTTVTNRGPLSYYYLAGDKLPAGVIEWQVQTYDQEDLVSPWSNTAIFNAVNPTNAPVILRPGAGEAINEARPFIQWSSTDQTAYHVQVLQGTTVLWEIERTSTNKAQTIGIDLENNRSYTFKVRVKGEGGLWSEYATIDIQTSFTPPINPWVDLEADEERGSISVSIENFVSSAPGGEPDAVKNDLYRRRQGETDWIRIAKDLPIHGYYVDYTPGSGVTYEYKARAWAANNTYSESQVVSIGFQLRHVILSIANDPFKYIQLAKDAQKSFSHGIERALLSFQGREYPASEFGTNKTLDMTLSFTLWSRDELNQLTEICESARPLLYRDRRGRREFITVQGVQVTDENPDFFSVSLTNPSKIFYSEEVEARS